MIDHETHGDIAVLRLSHGKVSALDTELCHALTVALDDVRDAAALVLTGTGSTFSAGVDLFRVVRGGTAYVASFFPALVRCFRALFEFPRPAIGAANGHAVAGGSVLINACDRRLGTTGRHGIPELVVGVAFPCVALEIMRCAVPHGAFQELVLTGTIVDAAQAEQRGLLDAVVDSDTLLEHALAEAAPLAAQPRAAFERVKRDLRAPFQRTIDEADDGEVLAIWSSEETHAAISAYLDRTVPKK